MGLVSIGHAEQRVLLNVMKQVEAGRPVPALRAAEKAALRAFMRRLGWVDSQHSDAKQGNK